MSYIHTLPRWQQLRKLVKDRDGWRCVKCGKAGRLEVDHITPVHQGGDPWEPANCQTLCRPCHFAKSRGERESERPDTPQRAAWRRLVRDLAESTPPTPAD